ncbi:putative sulfate exporter family transporter, partial [Alistipes ihumii]|uniref:putative sulfate exporter family transporter n=1 Tax=Alistipes ihumii TaxID=1470347 RepID=UPI003AB667B4
MRGVRIGADFWNREGQADIQFAPVIDADENQTSLSLATIFILNAVALFVFPVIGHWLG